MAIFKGYLLKAADKDAVFPLQYINEKSYSSSPNNRREIKSYRDDNTQNLIRVTAEGLKSTFKFSTMDGINLRAREEIKEFLDTAEVDSLERKVYLEYWNDEELRYKKGYFYRPNDTFPINSISKTDIKYGSITMEFIEY